MEPPNNEFPPRFDFKAFEEPAYQDWDSRGLFRANAASTKPPFTIVIPPPNITGSLHMGHALNNTLQDLLVRFERMRGREALYLPGTDHAGIATQYKVEQKLKDEEKKTRFDLGREEFLRRVRAWKEEYGGTILMQLRRLGFSCDWSRTRFTLDPAYARSVATAFVRLHRDGLVYRGRRLVNWCPSCRTALSDLEVVRRESPGNLWYIRYPIDGEPGRFVVVGTTRPETLLGDTAVAAHPSDERFKTLVGKTLALPVLGRKLPLIADPYVDPKFGTGLVKITPAHDFNDYEVGARHKLATIQVIGAEGRMTAEAGPYAGQDRFAARKGIVAQLEREGLLEKTEPRPVPLGRCYRCDTILEPYWSEQWFVSMKELAKPAVAAVQDGAIRFFPDRYKKTYLDWMENIKDWCVSRQLWWGHRIPVWTCSGCSGPVASVDPPSACSCGGSRMEQDPDVLDTWFSSSLWPFATLGWPDDTVDLAKFYPTDVLVTSRDIINLWVGRMIVMGYKFLGRPPFRRVVVHPQLQTIEGKRMSKSLGTGIDPLELMDEYGADALRWCLVEKCTGVQDVRFGLPHELLRKLGGTPQGRDDRSIVQARNFVTKVWNACRFVLTSIPEEQGTDSRPSELEDRWILSRMATVAGEYTADLEAYEFGRAAARLYRFVWDEFCDYYIELSKKRMADKTVPGVLLTCVDAILRLLHPVCPFVTEAIWRRLARPRTASAMTAPWPDPDASWVDRRLEEQFEKITGFVVQLRRFRREQNLPAKSVVTLEFIRCGDAELLQSARRPLEALANAVVAKSGPKFPVGDPDLKRCAAIPAAPFYALARTSGPVEDLGALRTKRDELRRKLDQIHSHLAQVPEEERSEKEAELRSLDGEWKTLQEKIQIFEDLG